VSCRGRVASILVRDNVESATERARALAASSVEVYPVSLKEIFLEHVRAK